MKKEIAGFQRMGSWKNIKNSIEGFLMKNIESAYLRTVKSKTFRIFKTGHRIWKAILDRKESDESTYLGELDEFVIGMATFFLLMMCFCLIGTPIVGPILWFVVPLLGLPRAQMTQQQYFSSLLYTEVWFAGIALVLLGFIALRVSIEWHLHYRSSTFIS